MVKREAPWVSRESRRPRTPQPVCVEGKIYPYQSAAKGQPLLRRLESAARMWNLEHTLEPGTVSSFFLQATLSQSAQAA